MLNMIDTQDKLKNFSEAQLIQEMQMPSGSAPQFMVLGEIERRKRMRAEAQKQEGLMKPTVAQEAVSAAGVPQQGIAQVAQSLAPKTDMTQNTGVMNIPASRLPGQPNQPQRMAGGGIMRLAPGGQMSGGTMTAIALLKVNYPELYERYKDSPELADVALAAVQEAKTPEKTGLEALEAPRSYNLLKTMFTDPTNDEISYQRRKDARDFGKDYAAEQARLSDKAITRGSGSDKLAMTPSEVEALIQGRRADAPAIGTTQGSMVSPSVLAIPQQLRDAVPTQQNPRLSMTPSEAEALFLDRAGAVAPIPAFDIVSERPAMDTTQGLMSVPQSVRDTVSPRQTPRLSDLVLAKPDVGSVGIAAARPPSISLSDPDASFESLQSGVEANPIPVTKSRQEERKMLAARPVLQALPVQINPVYSQEEIDAANQTLEAKQGLFEKIPAGPKEYFDISGKSALESGMATGEVVSVTPDGSINSAYISNPTEETIRPRIRPEFLDADPTDASGQAVSVTPDVATGNIIGNIVNEYGLRTGPEGATATIGPNAREAFEAQAVYDMFKGDSKPKDVKAQTPTEETIRPRIRPEGLGALIEPARKTSTNETAESSGAAKSSGSGDKQTFKSTAKGMSQSDWLALAQAGFVLMSTGDFGKAGQAGLEALKQSKDAELAERKFALDERLIEAKIAAAGRKGGAKAIPAAYLTDLRGQMEDKQAQLANLGPPKEGGFLSSASDPNAVLRRQLTEQIRSIQDQIDFMYRSRGLPTVSNTATRKVV